MAAFDQAQAATTWQERQDEAAGPGLAASLPTRGSDYAELSRRIRQEGLLDRRPTYYGLKIGLNTALLAAGWIAFLQLGDSWYQLVIAAWLAVVFTQIAFVGHDAGHRQIFRTRRPNDLIGLVPMPSG
jgi:fatty acid desaturase